MVKSTRLKLSRGAGMAIVIFGVIVMVYMAVTTVGLLNSKIMVQEYNRLRNTVEAAAAGSIIHISMSEDNQKQLSMGYIVNETGGGNLTTGEINNYYKLDHQLANKYTLELIKGSMKISDADVNDTNKVKILMIVIEPFYDENTYQRKYNIYYYGNNNPATPIHTDTVAVNNDFTSVQNKINTFINSATAAPYRSKVRNYNININGQKTYINTLVNNQYYLVLVNDFPLVTLLANNYDATNPDNFTPICSMQAAKSSRD